MPGGNPGRQRLPRARLTRLRNPATNPATSEALAILAGGGIDKIDEGFQKLMIMRKRQINEYMHRLEVIGMADRRERMAPAMRALLD